jgi:CrcB protein
VAEGKRRLVKAGGGGMAYFWIALGSALGGMLRHAGTLAVASRLGEVFPYGTLMVNVTGSLLMGLLAGLMGRPGEPLLGPEARLLAMTGFCGGYTTFSAFSLQTLALMHKGAWMAVAANIAASVAFCLLAVWAGYLLATSLGSLHGS